MIGDHPVVRDAAEPWSPPAWALGPEREFDVEFSSIAYLTVRVTARDVHRARALALYKVSGKDQNGRFIEGGPRCVGCPECRASGVVISASSLQLDSCEEVIELVVTEPTDSVA